MASLSFFQKGQSLTIHNSAPNGAGIQPFQCEQTHFQGIFEVHLQMANKWKVGVLFLQNEMDQTFQDLGKIAVTSANVDHSKQATQHPWMGKVINAIGKEEIQSNIMLISI